MLRVAIAGASGYTGFELVRILCAHPSVRDLHDFAPGSRKGSALTISTRPSCATAILCLKTQTRKSLPHRPISSLQPCRMRPPWT